jgi:hypothetical protein
MLPHTDLASTKANVQQCGAAPHRSTVGTELQRCPTLPLSAAVLGGVDGSAAVRDRAGGGNRAWACLRAGWLRRLALHRSLLPGQHRPQPHPRHTTVPAATITPPAPGKENPQLLTILRSTYCMMPPFPHTAPRRRPTSSNAGPHRTNRWHRTSALSNSAVVCGGSVWCRRVLLLSMTGPAVATGPGPVCEPVGSADWLSTVHPCPASTDPTSSLSDKRAGEPNSHPLSGNLAGHPNFIPATQRCRRLQPGRRHRERRILSC